MFLMTTLFLQINIALDGGRPPNPFSLLDIAFLPLDIIMGARRAKAVCDPMAFQSEGSRTICCVRRKACALAPP